MNFDIDSINGKNLPLNLELYNIGYLLGEKGIIYRILIFLSFCSKIEQGYEEKDRHAKIIKCLKAIENDNIKILQALSKLKISEKFLK